MLMLSAMLDAYACLFATLARCRGTRSEGLSRMERAHEEDGKGGGREGEREEIERVSVRGGLTEPVHVGIFYFYITHPPFPHSPFDLHGVPSLPATSPPTLQGLGK